MLSKRVKIMPVFGSEEPMYDFEGNAAGVHFSGTSSGVPASGTASGADYSPYAHSLLDPFRGPVVSQPSLTAPPMLPRLVKSNKNLNARYSDYLYVINWYSPDQAVECFVRSVSDGKFYRFPEEDLIPSLKLSDNYTQMAVQGGGFSLKSATYVGGILPPSGVVTAATLLDAPNLLVLTPEQVIAYAQNPLFGIAQVPIVDGVVTLAPPSFLSSQIIVPDNGNICPQGNNWKATDTLVFPTGPQPGSAWLDPAPGPNVVIFDTDGSEFIPPNLRGKVRFSLKANVLYSDPTTYGNARVIIYSNTVDAAGATLPINIVHNVTCLNSNQFGVIDYSAEFDTQYIIERITVEIGAAAGNMDLDNGVSKYNQAVLECFDLYNNGSQMPVTLISLSGMADGQQVAMESSMRFQLVPNADLQRNTSTRGEYQSDIAELIALQDIFSNPEQLGISFCYTGSRFADLQSAGHFALVAKFSNLQGQAAGKFGSRLKTFFQKAAPAIGAGIGALFGRPLEGMRATQSMMAAMPGGYTGNAGGAFHGSASGVIKGSASGKMRGELPKYQPKISTGKRGKHVEYSHAKPLPPFFQPKEGDVIQGNASGRGGTVGRRVLTDKQKGKIKEKAKEVKAQVLKRRREAEEIEEQKGESSRPIGANMRISSFQPESEEEDVSMSESEQSEQEVEEEIRPAKQPKAPAQGVNVVKPLPILKLQINKIRWIEDLQAEVKALQTVVGWKACNELLRKAPTRAADGTTGICPNLFSLGYFPFISADKRNTYWGIVIFSETAVLDEHGVGLEYQEQEGFFFHDSVSADFRTQVALTYNAMTNAARANAITRNYVLVLAAILDDAFKATYHFTDIAGPSAGLSIRMAMYNQPATTWFTGGYDVDGRIALIDGLYNKIGAAAFYGRPIIVQSPITEQVGAKLATAGINPLSFSDNLVGAPDPGFYLSVDSFAGAVGAARMVRPSRAGLNATTSEEAETARARAAEAIRINGSRNQSIAVNNNPEDNKTIDFNQFTVNDKFSTTKFFDWFGDAWDSVDPAKQQQILSLVYDIKAYENNDKFQPSKARFVLKKENGRWGLERIQTEERAESIAKVVPTYPPYKKLAAQIIPIKMPVAKKASGTRKGMSGLPSSNSKLKKIIYD